VLPTATVVTPIATALAPAQAPTAPAAFASATTASTITSPGVPPAQLAVGPQSDDSPLPILEEPQIIAPLEPTEELPAIPVEPGDAVPMPAQEQTAPISPALVRALGSAEGLFQAGAPLGSEFSLASVAAPIAQPQTAAAAGVAILIWGWWEARSKKEESENRRRRPLFQIF